MIKWNLDITNLYIHCNEVLSITNDFLYPSNSKIFEKEPPNNETSLQQTSFASPLTLSYIVVPLQSVVCSLSAAMNKAGAWQCWKISWDL